MSILVIGSTGTVGTQVVQEIARRGVKSTHSFTRHTPTTWITSFR